jgi:hypothetical protein
MVGAWIRPCPPQELTLIIRVPHHFNGIQAVRLGRGGMIQHIRMCFWNLEVGSWLLVSL